MTWHWSDPTSLETATSYDVDVALTKSAGGDSTTTVTGTLHVSAPGGDVTTALENLFAPAVADGWTVNVDRVQRYASHIVYGG
ncbi:hypothetical protein ACIPEL_36440 [Streptomyces griseoviridis]